MRDLVIKGSLVSLLIGSAIISSEAQSNTPPVLGAIPDQTVTEFTLLTVTNRATDAETPTNLLKYALIGQPSGVAITTDGIIRWIPSEPQGPGTNVITTIVQDDGQPPLIAMNSFTVIVYEANSAPFFPFVSDKTVAAGKTLTYTNTAIDQDLPTNTLSYALLDPPAGTVIDSGSGVIQFSPDSSQEGKQTITTVATDNGSPPMSGTNKFNVTVLSSNAVVTRMDALMPAKFSITGYIQAEIPIGPTSTIPVVQIAKFSNKDILSSIGSSLGSGTNNLFPPNAQLYLKLPNLSASAAIFVVRYGEVETNVSSYLQLFAAGSGLVTAVKSQSANGKTNQVEYTTLEFDLFTGYGTFQVTGLSTIRSSSVVDKGHVVHATPVLSGLVAQVSGGGSIAGRTAFFRGTVALGNRKVENIALPSP